MRIWSATPIPPLIVFSSEHYKNPSGTSSISPCKLVKLVLPPVFSCIQVDTSTSSRRFSNTPNLCRGYEGEIIEANLGSTWYLEVDPEVQFRSCDERARVINKLSQLTDALIIDNTILLADWLCHLSGQDMNNQTWIIFVRTGD